MTCGDYIIHIDNAEDGDKFRIIYQRYSRLMIYCAKKIVNDHHIAEDITQQTFMKVIPRLKTISLEEPEKTKNLLITITISGELFEFNNSKIIKKGGCCVCEQKIK